MELRNHCRAILLLFNLLLIALISNKTNINNTKDFISLKVVKQSLPIIPEFNHSELSHSNFFDKNSHSIKHRWMRIKGFKFCDMLDGSVIDGFEPISILDGPAHQISKPKFILQFEKFASRLAGQIRTVAQVSETTAQRFACICSIQGNHPVSNISKLPLLKHLNGKRYLQKYLPAFQAIKKSRHKLAYLITLNNEDGFKNFLALLEKIDDGNAIILISVPKELEKLHHRVREHVTKSEGLKKQKTIHMATYMPSKRHSNFEMLICRLLAYFELENLSHWDYVINLENYEWPLRSNNDIHRILQQRAGSSWIDYWIDSKKATKNYFEQFADSNGKAFTTMPWRFTDWTIYQGKSDIILSRNAVETLKTNTASLEFLASLEFSKNCMELFIPTVLLNLNPSKVIQEQKRLIRKERYWIGWSDRALIPPGSLDPSYLFIRPFNVYGFYGEERKLKEWIDANHYNLQHTSPCLQMQLGFREECIRQLVSPIAAKNEIIIIPTNAAHLEMAENLRCSLARLGLRNVIFWALDLSAHEKLLKMNKVSYFIPRVKGVGIALHRKDPDLIRMLRNKPIVVLKLLNAGFNVWYLDADTTAIKDFTEKTVYHIAPFWADIMMTSTSRVDVENSNRTKGISAGIMHFSAHKKSFQFLSEVIDLLETNADLSDEDAFQTVAARSTITFDDSNRGILYPESKPLIYKIPHRIFNKPRIHLLDPVEFPSLASGDISKAFIVHNNIPGSSSQLLKKKNLWFLKGNKCQFD